MAATDAGDGPTPRREGPQAPVDDFQLPWRDFAEFFAARTDAEQLFLVELDHDAGTRAEWPVGSWRGRVHATASWLQEEGVGPGDNVATLAGNSADALALAYACWVLGACCVPLNPGDGADRQAYVVADAQVRVLVHGPVWRERAAAIAARSPVPLRAVEDLPARDPGSAPSAQQAAQGPGVEPAAREHGVDLHADAVRVYTSGTTGEPKGVVLTAANLLTDCDALLGGLGWGADTRVLTVLPVHHVNGLVISSLLPWYGGFSTVLCDRFRSERFWADAADEQATVCSVVPSLLEFLLSSDGNARALLRELLCGAGPLLSETVLSFERTFGVPVRHLYGLSETTAVATLMPRLPEAERTCWYRDFGFPSIGPTLPHVAMSVLGKDDTPLPEGQRGELAIRGATVMRGYAGHPKATEEAFRGGWFHSGDEGFWTPGPDGEPFYFITGRIKEMIIRGGVNLSPFEIDEVLRAHPAVRYALAVPFDNRFYGEEVAAYVVAAEPVSEEELLAYCAQRLDFARQPKVVVFGDDVPYTVTGKAKRLELKRRLAEDLAAHRDTQFRRPGAPGPGAPPSG
ncbi:MAG: acyl--CoA ligase [Actinomycetota bacterium]|nr:acyl--CoA ligase [Actinomycetota bacterium]